MLKKPLFALFCLLLITGCGQPAKNQGVFKTIEKSGVLDYAHDVTHPKLRIKTQYRLWKTQRKLDKAQKQAWNNLDTQWQQFAQKWAPAQK